MCPQSLGMFEANIFTKEEVTPAGRDELCCPAISGSGLVFSGKFLTVKFVTGPPVICQSMFLSMCPHSFGYVHYRCVHIPQGCRQSMSSPKRRLLPLAVARFGFPMSYFVWILLRSDLVFGAIEATSLKLSPFRGNLRRSTCFMWKFFVWSNL
jgi:hypothetical protein